MKEVLIESHFLPSLEYFCAIADFDQVLLENHEHFVKQSFRNRCYILTSHGVEMLTVPLIGKHGKIPFGEIRMEPGIKWRNNHWRTIRSAYAKAPFFEHFAGEIHNELFSNYGFLHELNTAVLSLWLRNLGMTKTISATVAYQKEHPDRYDLRSVITAKQNWSEREFYQPQRYYQIFGNAFAENLSLLDLLFCEGPAAAGTLNASRKKILNK